MKRLLMAMMLMPLMALAYETEVVDGITWRYTVTDGKAQIGTGSYSSTAISYGTAGAITIPSTLGKCPVTSIGDCAFYDCSGLESVAIPSSVTSIGSSSFYNCSGLKSVTIPESVTCIGEQAFRDCGGLESVIMSKGVTSIGQHAFLGCSRLESVTIPPSVTSIGNWAFSGCSGLTSVTIPNSVMSIGEGAFGDCSGLTNMVLPFVGSRRGNSGSEAALFGYIFGTHGGETRQYYKSSGWFCDCKIPSSLKSVTITDETGIGYGAFSGCGWIESVTIPSSVTSIGSCAFDGCDGLKSVAIPPCVTSLSSTFPSSYQDITKVEFVGEWTNIRYDAFRDCSGLKSVTIPESVTSIGDSAFYGCSGLTSVTIPSSVTSIGNWAFLGCSGLKSVTIPESVASIGNSAFYGCSGLTSVTIPSSVTSIGNCAFLGCSGLESVIVSKGVTSIGQRAFLGCSTLISVTIPSSVTSVGVGAFDGTPFLDNQPDGMVIFGGALYACKGECPSSVTIPSSVTSISDGAFSGCNALTSVTIPPCVTNLSSIFSSSYQNITNVEFVGEWTSIVDSAFHDCSGLTSVTIPEGVTNIGSKAFYNCYGLKSVAIPEGVTSIGDYAFGYCGGLTSVTIPSSVTSIGRNAFYGCSALTLVAIPPCVTRLSSTFPSAYKNITSVEFVGEWTSIGESVFYGCRGLTEVTIPLSVTSIEGHAFCDCSGLTEVTVPESVTNIGDYAFKGCSGLTSVTIPSSVTSIGEGAFGDCSGLTNMVLPFVGSRRGDIGYYEKEKALFGYIFGTSTLSQSGWTYQGAAYCNIPNSLRSVAITDETHIGDDAFRGCSRLTSITIPSTVTSIGSEVFYNCYGLKSVAIPEGMTSIGYEAFYNCDGLTSVTIPSSVTSIGSFAFAYCSGLTSVAIPSSVTRIMGGAFEGCNALKTVIVGYGDEYRMKVLLEGCRFGVSRVAFVVEDGGPYSETVDGVEWTFVVNDSKAEVCALFANADAIVIPSMLGGCQVVSIGDSAFGSCGGLESVTIPSSVTSIGRDAFLDCDALGTIFVGLGDEDRMRVLLSGSGLDVSGVTFALADSGPYTETVDGVEWTFVVNAGNAEVRSSSANTGAIAMPSILGGCRVASIGAKAFFGCSGLTSVTIPSSVTSVEAGAFAGCGSISDVVLHNVSVSQRIVPELIAGTAWTEESEIFARHKVYRSNFISHSQTTAIEFEIPEGMEQLVFSWKVGSEGDYDWLTWYLDGVQKDRISGSRDWATLTNKLDGAAHRLKFVYSKDSWGSTSPDCGWVSILSSGQEPMLMLKGIFPDSPVATVTIGDETRDLLDGFFAGCGELTRVVFEGETPPNASDDVFNGAPSDLKVCVRMPLCGWLEALLECEWHGRKVAVLIPPDYGVAELPQLQKQGLFFAGWTWANGNPVTDGHARTEDEEVIPHWASICEWLGLSENVAAAIGGDVPWVGETVEGAKIAASGEIGDSQESWLEVAIPGPAHVSFDWRVSCEESALDDSDEEVFFDGLEFLVDGETVGTIAGETDWATVSLDLTDAGPHAIRWRYFKDDASLEGDDGGAIANLVVTPYATVTFAAGGDAAGDLPEDVTCLVGTSVSLPSASSLAWAKHRFVGWSDGEAVYQPGAEYEVAEVETAFTAVWEEKRLATPTITVPAVFAADTIEVVISAESGASVYYTLDGSDPTDASPLYAEPFSVADDCTVRAIALRDDWFDSVVATATTQKATYTVRFDAGSCGVISSGDAVQTVKYGGAATAPTVGPDAWHAFDGWDKPFDRVTGDLTVTANYRLAARAVSDVDCYVDRGVTSSETGVGAYLDDAAEDGCVIRMTEDAAWCAIAVEGYCRVSCAIDPEDVVCTVDGEERAIVIDSGRMVVEVTGEGTHEVRWTGKAQLSDFEVVSAALLSFAAAGGETGDVPATIAMYEGDEVTLPGAGSLVLAKHRFVGWRDGEAVLPPKSVYAGSLETKTLTAVWEEKHLAAPVIDAPEYFEAESAQVILNAEDGAEIRYTLDGTAPDASSALYEGPFAVGETVTIRAIALRDDWFDSAVAELQVVRGPWTFGEYLEMPEQTFSTSGDEEWVRAKGEGEDGEGSYALRSGAIGDSQESVLSMKIQGAGTVTFKYCVSSQAKKGVISDGLAVRLDGSDEKAFRDGGDTGWKEAEVSVSGAGEHTVAWVYWKNASGFDGADCAWLDSVKWTPTGPSVVNDPSAVVTGDAESGYVVVPSADLEQVEVELNGIDPSKVTVEVSVGVASVKPNGAKVKVVSAGADITEFLNIPAAVDGVIDLSAATVKDAVVTEVLDPEKGAVVELNSANPSLTTAPTKIGLVYQFREAATLEGFGSKTPSATKVGDGEPWALPITVKGGVSGFYSVDIGKGSASLP